MSPASRGGRRRSRIQSMSVKSSIDPMRRDEVPCFDSGYKTSSTKTSLYSYQAKQPMDMSWGLRGDIPCSILKSITIKSPYLVKDDNGIEVVSQIGPENSGCFLDDDSPTKRATSQRYQLLHAIDLEALPDFETNDFESYNRDSDQPGVNDILYYNDLMEDTVAPHGCRMDDQRCIVKDITLEKKNKKDEYGIGLGTAQYGRLFVNCIRPGSLADRNGIIFGDEITMINESETLYCSAPQAAR
ncbi:hypothetical protein SARC_03535 [Sphaeroforma arctica JP610]|uniref:PDZ domain-containing protein n=1 Tax=Sphaeroforma arctica JP610 TaxID=667725 RepID=A0A0L0G5L2_9EUKA|nr:hypothetical protein SARC_03535 [Sphaeroforma arctica JP610]KNC84234.1 hypothetical protein SARC_03535 [Sphaeroforma arctica JP610]|eukprot:XP_014158136.1 hypothetical protein SARC_03535 [Sphaeroforma arctica JP610]